MTRREGEHKHAQRVAHARRQDHRQPDSELTANERRNARRDARREARKAAR